MELIASADNNWGIGHGGQLLFTVSEDMRRFRQLTTGNIVVMGRATCLSLPKGALPQRENIVLSGDPDFQREGFTILPSLTELERWLKLNATGRKAFVIGGEQVYRALLPYCTVAHITRFYHSFTADRFLPDLQADPAWKLASREPGGQQAGIAYDFCTYVRTA